MNKILLLSLGFYFSLMGAASADDQFESCRGPALETAGATQSRLSKQLLLAGLKYAQDHSNPRTGFVEDTVGNYQDLPSPSRIRASISSTGFLMALVADLAVKGYVSRDFAVSYCERPLLAVIRKQASDQKAASQGTQNQNAISFKGWFAHFIDWETGERWNDDTEYATTDSTWFYSGAMVCAAIFPSSPLPKLVDKIFSQVDFNALRTDGGTQPNKLTLSMSYTPNRGYNRAQWEIYQHSWLVYLLGMGAPNPTFRLPAASWAAWDRTGSRIGLPQSSLNGKVLYGDRRALFSHYFPDLFLPPQAIQEVCGIDYLKNSQLATRFNREMALRDKTSLTFRSGLWGLDAGPNPVVRNLVLDAPTVSVGDLSSNTYGVNSPFKRNGTACPACVLATAMFEPNLVFTDLKQWCEDPRFGEKIWGKYGPANGINLDYGWISPVALSGIVGPMALSVANLDDKTSIWKYFSKSEVVIRGLAAVRRAPLPPRGCLLPEH